MKVDLSKNQLTSLPDDLGNLISLQHLDLYNNKLSVLPVSFSQLRVGFRATATWFGSWTVSSASVCLALQSLKWLDLKDNPLEAGLAKAAGDCLDEKQCRQCASRVRKTCRRSTTSASS